MRREAAWLGEHLQTFPDDDLSPILSIGSGTQAFRNTFQPWIDRDVYGPLESRQVAVLHHEMSPAPGVDITGDLGDERVRAQLRTLGVRCILCLNVFEHVSDRAGLAEALVAALPANGLAVVTVPRKFPYHPDPIDTMFRPSARELAALFNGVTVVDSGNVRCESLLGYWIRKPGKIGAIRKAFNGTGAAASSVATHPGVEQPKTSTADLARMAFLSTEITYVTMRRLPT